MSSIGKHKKDLLKTCQYSLYYQMDRLKDIADFGPEVKSVDPVTALVRGNPFIWGR